MATAAVLAAEAEEVAAEVEAAEEEAEGAEAEGSLEVSLAGFARVEAEAVATRPWTARQAEGGAAAEDRRVPECIVWG